MELVTYQINGKYLFAECADEAMRVKYINAMSRWKQRNVQTLLRFVHKTAYFSIGILIPCPSFLCELQLLRIGTKGKLLTQPHGALSFELQLNITLNVTPVRC